jgi:hypothetical protein
MPILNELIQMTSKSELDEQVKHICDEIMKEERPKFANPFDEPVGSNIFLAVQFPDKKYVSFLCLEREAKEKYIVSQWSRLNNGTILKRKKVWEVVDLGKAEKILKFYAETLKYVRGE